MTTEAASVDHHRFAETFGPLQFHVFRALWIGAVVSNIGSWMQTVGAQWLLVKAPDSSILVALVQTASAAPFLVLGLAAGVLGEFLNRRRILITVQAFQVLVGVGLAVLTATHLMTPPLLLTLTFLLGAGSAVQLPAYQALIPDLVPRNLIPSAAALGSIGVNIARAIGPAVAGTLIGVLGVPVVFAVDAATFFTFLLIVLSWRGYVQAPIRAEPFLDATRAGIRYVLNSGVVRRIYTRLAMALVPANALWALLPFVAKDRLHLGSAGYGVLLAALGIGSILGAVLLPRFRRQLGPNKTTMFAAAVFGLGSIASVVSGVASVTVGILVVSGIAWISIIASLNGAVQAFLPTWVRARGLSVYQLVFYGSSAIGATLSGALAQALGYQVVCFSAGILLLAVAASQLVLPLLDAREMERATAALPLENEPAEPSLDENAATLVLLRYRVAPEKQADFIAHTRQVEASRRRTGARRWDLYQSREEADTFIEVFSVGSWREHLAQHESRLTDYDRKVLDQSERYAEGRVDVIHLLAIDTNSTPPGNTSRKRAHDLPREHHW